MNKVKFKYICIAILCSLPVKFFGQLGINNKPFHFGEFGTPGSIPVTGLGGVATNGLFNNYDISFHNEIWASTFMGNFMTGMAWEWQVVHWWPDANPNVLFYAPGNSIDIFNGIDDPFGLNDRNTMHMPDGPDKIFINKKIYHNFKPLTYFISNSQIDFSQNYIPLKRFGDGSLSYDTYSSTSNIECYYLADNTTNATKLYGWVHNLNNYWFNKFYYYSDGTTAIDFENLDGCEESKGIDPLFSIDGLLPNTYYDIQHFYTRLNETPVNFSPYIVETNSAGELYIDVTALGCDSINADFGFKVSVSTSLKITNNPTKSISTFKRMLPGLNFNPLNSNLVCRYNSINNNYTLLADRSSLVLLKIDSSGYVYDNNSLSMGYWAPNLILDNNEFVVYTNIGNQMKEFMKFDTSLNKIIIAKVYYNTGWSGTDRSSIFKTHDQGYLLSGNKNNWYTPTVLKTDSSGNIIWSKYLTQIDGGIQELIQTQDSGIVIACNTINMGNCIIKLDKSGNALWGKSYIRPKGYVHSIIENNDGTLVMSGAIDSLNNVLTSPLFTTQLFIAKTDSLGNIIWSKSFNDIINGLREYRSKIIRTNDNGYALLATVSNNYNGNDDLLLIKLDEYGDTMWVRVHGSDSSGEIGHYIEQLNDGGYIISGGTNSNQPIGGAYLVKTDTLGHTETLCQEKNMTLEIGNLFINDSIITVNSIPYTINVGIPDTTHQPPQTFYTYDGCILDDIPELETKESAALNIYPNPTDGRFSIATKMSTPLKTEIEIYDINSRRVYSGTTTESVTSIDLTGNARGLYFVKLSNERFVKTGKVMVY